MYKTTEIASDALQSDNPVHQRLFFPYLEAAQIVSGKVLEIGCGAGRGVEVLSPVVAHYTGIDKNAPLLKMLGEKYPQHTFIDQHLPPLQGLADNSFDFIVTFQVIEHIEDDDYFVREAHRVLKPGGKMLLTTVNRKFSLTRNPWHVREYTADELKSLIGRYFSEVDTKGIHGNEKVMNYYEQNKRSVEKITRFDVLNLQYRLPRWMLQVPYELANRLSRNMLQQSNNQLVTGITWKDYLLTKQPAESLDFFYVATK
jgi:2-polyprenyl-3-methyl-5-hydroxy-6-metoxy-1,4-benzoquinol methylase